MATESKEVRVASSSFSASSTTQVSSSTSTKTESRSEKSIQMAQIAGEERKQEAMKRREEFVMKKSEARTQTVKTTQQLHKEREDIIQKEV